MNRPGAPNTLCPRHFRDVYTGDHRRGLGRSRTPLPETLLSLRVYDAEEAQASSNLQQIETEHREILTAVQSGDAEMARILMIAHQARTRDLRIAAMARR